MPDREEQWAVFWCSLLSPLLYGEIAPGEAGRFIDQLAATAQVFPDGQRRRPSRATLWRKWKRYRDGGFEALFRKRRKDRGQPRRSTPAMIAKAVELKTEQPYRSDVPINRFLQTEFGRTIPKSTLYRHLKRAGATRRKLGISRQKVRCRSHPRPLQRPLAGRLRGRPLRAGRRRGVCHPSVGVHRLP